ncbi:MAG: hypothetical protein ACSW8J_07115 [bacterium]
MITYPQVIHKLSTELSTGFGQLSTGFGKLSTGLSTAKSLEIKGF